MPNALQRFDDSLACVADRPEGGRCFGVLRRLEEKLECKACGYSYPLVRDVPVLKSDAASADAAEWFESMYDGRSRSVDIASGYLAPERDALERFVRSHGLSGPFLEVGCGTGIFAEIVPDFVGVEYSLTSLLVPGFEDFARICADARRLPFADGTFQCAFSFNTLEHVPEVHLAFAEMDRVVAPGGYLFLKPAWHCARYVTELVHVKPYSELSGRQKVTKALLPITTSKAYKLATWLPKRLKRRMTAGERNPLSYGRLTPYQGADWVADADAVASIDAHEAILYYTSRGYSCLSHPIPLGQLIAGHDIVILRKEAASAVAASG